MRTCSACRAVAPLCDACVDAAAAQLIGVARARGYWWGRAVRGVMPGPPWLEYDEPGAERVRMIARRKVEELAQRDERLLELLARAAAEAARDAYLETTPIPGVVFSVKMPR